MSVDSELILAIDSSSPLTAVAVGKVDEHKGCFVLAETLSSEIQLDASDNLPNSGSSELLLHCIDLALKRSGSELANVSKLVVNIGPGSFTGLRNGIVSAQGLAARRQLPVLGVSRMLAAAVPYQENSDVLAISLRASRNEFYLLWLKVLPKDITLHGRVAVSILQELIVIPESQLEQAVEAGRLNFVAGAERRFQRIELGPVESAAWLLQAASELSLHHPAEEGASGQKTAELFWQEGQGGFGLEPAYIKGTQARSLKERGIIVPLSENLDPLKSLG